MRKQLGSSTCWSSIRLYSLAIYRTNVTQSLLNVPKTRRFSFCGQWSNEISLNVDVRKRKARKFIVFGCLRNLWRDLIFLESTVFWNIGRISFFFFIIIKSFQMSFRLVKLIPIVMDFVFFKKRLGKCISIINNWKGLFASQCKIRLVSLRELIVSNSLSSLKYILELNGNAINRSLIWKIFKVVLFRSALKKCVGDVNWIFYWRISFNPISR